MQTTVNTGKGPVTSANCPILATVPVTWNLEEVDLTGAICCGFHQEWGTITMTDGSRLVISTGAGLGTPWLQAKLTRDGQTRYFRANVEGLGNALLGELFPEEVHQCETPAS